MGIHTDAGNTGLTEVKSSFFFVRRREASLLQERNDKGAQATVHMERDFVRGSEARQCRNIIDNAMRKVRSRTNEQDSVRVDQPANSSNFNLVVGSRAGNTVELDSKVMRSLDKRSVGSIGDNPSGCQ